MGDLQAWWCIGTTRNTGDVDLAIRDVLGVFEDGLILGVPVGDGTLHVAVLSEIKLLDLSCSSLHAGPGI